MKKTIYRKAILHIILLAFLITNLSGCLMESMSVSEGNPSASEVASGNSPIAAAVKKGRIKNPKIEIDYDESRFNIGGNNAFYILPGLENFPRAMAYFKVLDYNSRGEFVYLYVTPSYISPEEVRAYATDMEKKYGTASKNSVTVPKGRREDYEYDAEVLMAYNPDTGDYHVMEAKAYAIDKENEFDPKSEGRPYYYQAKAAIGMESSAELTVEAVARESEIGILRGASSAASIGAAINGSQVAPPMNGASSSRDTAKPVDGIYLEQRALASKVAGKEEYLLFDEMGSGRVYDADGNTFRSYNYIWQIDSRLSAVEKELLSKENETQAENIDADSAFEKWRQKREEAKGATANSGAKMSAVVTDAAMAGTYESFLSVNFFTGSLPYAPGSKTLSKTLLFYRENISTLDGAEPLLSTNENSDKQSGLWMSLNGRYFPSESAAKEAPGADLRKIKSGGYGAEYADKFSPFSMIGSNQLTFIVGMENVMEESFVSPMYKKYEYILDQYDFRNGLRMAFGRPWISTEGFRAFQAMQAALIKGIIEERMFEANANGGLSNDESMVQLITEELERLKLIPKPGAFTGRDDGGIWNESLLTFDKSKPYVTTVMDSLHLLTLVSENGVVSPYVFQVDYYGEGVNGDSAFQAKRETKIRNKDLTEEMERTYYVYDPDKADKELADNSALSRYGEQAEELKILLRSGPFEDMENMGDVDDPLESLVRELALGEAMEILESLPSSVREDLLRLAFGYYTVNEKSERFPYTYYLEFASKAGVITRDAERGLVSTMGGSLASTSDGVLVATSRNDKAFSMLTGIKSVGNVTSPITAEMAAMYSGNEITYAREVYFLADLYTSGDAYDVVQTTYQSPDGEKEDKSLIVLRTGKGIRIFERNSAGGYRFYDKDYYAFGEFLDPGGYEENAYYANYKEYLPLEIPAYSGEAESLVNSEGIFQTFRQTYADGIRAGNISLFNTNEQIRKYARGFIPLSAFFTSTGYTRSTEDRAKEAAKEGMERIQEREAAKAANGAGAAAGSAESAEGIRAARGAEAALNGSPNKDTVSMPDADSNARFSGRFTSAENISLIGKNEVLVCSMESGTKILHLNTGEIAEDRAGSYYRLFQIGRSSRFKLIGFDNTENAYLDTDLCRSKIYEIDYSNEELDKTLIESLKQVILQYARDYLYREFRTALDNEGEMIRVDPTEDEKNEESEAGQIFSPHAAGWKAALTRLERDHSIYSSPEELFTYTEDIRKSIAQVRPAMTRLYELSGAPALAANSLKRSEPYWKNLESRMTMAQNVDALMDILVEIRMHDEVLPSLKDQAQAEKYKGYKEVLDYTAEQGKISANEIFGDEDGGSAFRTLSENAGTAERDRIRQQYRLDVEKDIMNDYLSHMDALSVEGEDRSDSISAASNSVSSDSLYTMENYNRFHSYLEGLLSQVNPDNFLLKADQKAEEFAELINHGPGSLKGAPLEAMKDRVKKALPEIDTVWKAEELIIQEKIEHNSSYSSFIEWFTDYEERAEIGEYADLPGVSEENREKALSGEARIKYLRQSEAYKSIMGDIRSDEYVKSFLSAHKETFEDYLKEVIRASGAGFIKNENDTVENSYYADVLQESKNVGKASVSEGAAASNNAENYRQ